MVGFLSFHIMAVEVVRFLEFRPLTIEVEEDSEVSFHGFDPMLKVVLTSYLNLSKAQRFQFMKLIPC